MGRMIGMEHPLCLKSIGKQMLICSPPQFGGLLLYCKPPPACELVLGKHLEGSVVNNIIKIQNKIITPALQILHNL